VLAAKDASGRDVAASATVDDRPTTIDGRALEVDPGTHTIRVDDPGRASVVERVVVRQGEKGRLVAIRLPEPAGAPAPSAPVEPSKAPPVASLVLAGLGVVALGTFTYFGAKGRADSLAVQAQRCLPHCPEGEVDQANHELVAADVSLVTGLVALGVATTLWFIGPRSPFSKPPSAGAPRAVGIAW